MSIESTLDQVLTLNHKMLWIQNVRHGNCTKFLVKVPNLQILNLALWCGIWHDTYMVLVTYVVCFDSLM